VRLGHCGEGFHFLPTVAEIGGAQGADGLSPGHGPVHACSLGALTDEALRAGLVNRVLGADFDVDGFSYVAAWVPQSGRIDMRVRARRAMTVAVPALDLTVDSTMLWVGAGLAVISALRTGPGDDPGPVTTIRAGTEGPAENPVVKGKGDRRDCWDCVLPSCTCFCGNRARLASSGRKPRSAVCLSLGWRSVDHGPYGPESRKNRRYQVAYSPSVVFHPTGPPSGECIPAATTCPSCRGLPTK